MRGARKLIRAKRKLRAPLNKSKRAAIQVRNFDGALMLTALVGAMKHKILPRTGR